MRVAACFRVSRTAVYVHVLLKCLYESFRVNVRLVRLAVRCVSRPVRTPDYVRDGVRRSRRSAADADKQLCTGARDAAVGRPRINRGRRVHAAALPA